MTKRELVIQVASNLGYTQNEVSAVVQTMLDTISEALAEGERLEIRNFGVFEVKTRDARIGRNPRTGEEVPISQKKVASFKPGKTLKEWVQAGPEHKPAGLFEPESTEEETFSQSASSPPESGPLETPAPRPTEHHKADAAENGDSDESNGPGEQQSLF